MNAVGVVEPLEPLHKLKVVLESALYQLLHRNHLRPHRNVKYAASLHRQKPGKCEPNWGKGCVYMRENARKSCWTLATICTCFFKQYHRHHLHNSMTSKCTLKAMRIQTYSDKRFPYSKSKIEIFSQNRIKSISRFYNKLVHRFLLTWNTFIFDRDNVATFCKPEIVAVINRKRKYITQILRAHVRIQR